MTGTVAAVTVTTQVAVLLPSSVVAVMVAVPGATAVTLPLVSTVATPGALLSQVTDLSVALSGVMAAIRVSLLPTSRVKLVLFSSTLVTL